MRESVRSEWIRFNEPMESRVPWMYPDLKGLVSIGIGNMIDPIDLARGLPFVRPDGSRATWPEVATEWRLCKSFADHLRVRQGMGSGYVKRYMRLRLTNEAIDGFVMAKLAEMEAVLKQGFTDFEEWPADAQMGALSLAWACGPAYWRPEAGRSYFPKLTAALRAGDFTTASIECFMPEEKTISGLRPRNRANRLLFENAEIVKNCVLPYETLYWPRELGKEMPGEAITLPEGVAEQPAPIVHAFPEHEDIVYDLDTDSDKPPPEAA